MNRIESDPPPPGLVEQNNWTAIIPAAGKGTRLGFDRPKILYSVGNKTILERLAETLEPLARQFVFVLSENGRPHVEPHLQRLLPGRYTVAIQEDPKGMADAVWSAREHVSTPFTLVVWGDQIGVNRQTVEFCMKNHEERPNAACTFPTFVRSDPYIHFQCDSQGKLEKVLQVREGDSPPPFGESDCGLFCFETKLLFEGLQLAKTLPRMYGANTGEWNLLPLLEILDLEATSLTAVRVHNVSETIGVNSSADARQMEKCWNDSRTDR
jgi:bifunctional N-acetylglucosamine-1-phosphate-uridyltransferase/glucosamine-1-phosphate-acetyltransferase GlmU-like protein